MLRVLLIEDNRFDAMIVTGQLKGVAEVQHAPNMAAALHYAQEYLFDAAILDLDLGEGENNAVQAFISLSRRPMPLLVYSGSELSSEDRPWVDGYLPKPTSKTALIKLLRSIIADAERSCTAQTYARLRKVTTGLKALAAM